MFAKRNHTFANFQICARLVQRDLIIFVRVIKRRLINTAVWMGMMIYVYEYIGFSSVTGWGLFIACSECADYGFAGVFSNILRLVADIKGPRTISYYLTLPIPQSYVFFSVIVSAVIQHLLIAAILLPITKLVLQERFDLTRVSYGKLLCVFVCAYLFYGSLVLFYTSMISSIDDFNNVYIRTRDTLFWMGAYFFTWHQLYQKNYVLAYLDLLNPFVYACEGMRAAVMGYPDALCAWLCCAALLAFAAVCGSIGLRRMMKQLDCL